MTVAIIAIKFRQESIAYQILKYLAMNCQVYQHYLNPYLAPIAPLFN